MNENNRNYRIDPERGIVVPNYCAAQLPKITVEIKSGRTTYRFTARLTFAIFFEILYNI